MKRIKGSYVREWTNKGLGKATKEDYEKCNPAFKGQKESIYSIIQPILLSKLKVLCKRTERQNLEITINILIPEI